MMAVYPAPASVSSGAVIRPAARNHASSD